MNTLRDLFLDELADMYDAEHRIIKALPKLVKAATCKDLQKALLTHLQETKGQVTKLEKVFKSFGEKAKGKKCEATVGLLKEGDEIASENKGSPTINAAIISAGQKVEHYEIASYGCLRDWATLLGNPTAANLIQEILDQEAAADKKLGELAGKLNQEALGNYEDEPSSSRTSPMTRSRNSNKLPASRRDAVLN